jgi:deazaflavin-dependent oxidoreductase (nitroreductase family)
MPSDRLFRMVNAYHRTVLKATFGKVGWKAAGMPVVQLTTKGRRSGEPRTVLVTSPLQLGDSVVIVASRAGDAKHPAWLLNQRDDARVEVTMDGVARPMVAREATGDERARLWADLVAAQDRYSGYQSKTDRTLPVVVLDPVD